MYKPLSKPPLHDRKNFMLPKINDKTLPYIRNNSNASTRTRKKDDSFSQMNSNDSNDVSYISTNSNSSIGLNKKNPTFKIVKDVKEKYKKNSLNYKKKH